MQGSRKGNQPLRGGFGIVRPPGSIAENDFLSLCIRCSRCADACEANCIKFLTPGEGRKHGTPYILPVAKGCTLCLECGKACPTGAILPIEKKQDAKMGIAIVDERLCVSHNGSGVCGACFTVCPLRGKAITQAIRNAPEVHDEHCTGCGLCEYACIVDERPGLRAIMVKGRTA